MRFRLTHGRTFISTGRSRCPYLNLNFRSIPVKGGVIEDGEYYVVTEKGIGYVLFYALMIALGIQRFTGAISL